MVQQLLMKAFIMKLNTFFKNNLLIVRKFILTNKVEFDAFKFVKNRK